MWRSFKKKCVALLQFLRLVKKPEVKEEMPEPIKVPIVTENVDVTAVKLLDKDIQKLYNHVRNHTQWAHDYEEIVYKKLIKKVTKLEGIMQYYRRNNYTDFSLYVYHDIVNRLNDCVIPKPWTGSKYRITDWLVKVDKLIRESVKTADTYLNGNPRIVSKNVVDLSSVRRQKSLKRRIDKSQRNFKSI